MRRFLTVAAMALAWAAAVASPGRAEGLRKGQAGYGGVEVTFAYPAGWGAMKTVKPAPEGEEPAEETGPVAMVPVIDGTMKWEGVTFAVDPGAPAEPYERSFVAVAKAPAKFKDDEGAGGGDDPFALTAKVKAGALEPLEAIWKARALPPEVLARLAGPPGGWTGEETEGEGPYTAGWWGNLDAQMKIFDPQYAESADGEWRGVSFLFTESQDASFEVDWRAVLYSPERRTVVIVNVVANGTPEIRKRADGLVTEGATDEEVTARLKKAEDFVRRRANYAGTALDALVTQGEALAGSLKTVGEGK